MSEESRAVNFRILTLLVGLIYSCTNIFKRSVVPDLQDRQPDTNNVCNWNRRSGCSFCLLLLENYRQIQYRGLFQVREWMVVSYSECVW